MQAFSRSLILAAAMAAATPCLAETVKLTFLHVNDVYEYKPGRSGGGLAELSTLLAQERQRHPGAVFTFGGDLLSPSLASTVTKGAHLIRFFNELDVAAAVVGNHEFDFGPANLAQQIKDSRFTWLAANMLDAQGRPFGGVAPTALREVNGVKVGFLGVVATDTPDVSDARGVTFTPVLPAAQAAANALRAEGAEVVVALTHLDVAEDRRLAKEVKGIDLVLGGHDHTPYQLHDGGAPVIKAGENAEWLAEVDLAVTRGGGRTTVGLAGWRLVPTNGVAPDGRLLPMVAEMDGMLNQSLDQPAGKLETALDSRSGTVRTGEAAIGNLFADALRQRLGTDVALVNGGAIRRGTEYPAGTVLTRRDIRMELPFNNVVVSLELTGAQLLAALEHGLSEVEDAAGRFPQVSGMAVSWDPARKPGNRVVSVAVGGRPLDKAKTYRLATIDYLARGGDGYEVLKGGKVAIGAANGPMLAAVVTEHIAGANGLAPKVEGRVKAVGR